LIPSLPPVEKSLIRHIVCLEKTYQLPLGILAQIIRNAAVARVTKVGITTTLIAACSTATWLSYIF
jgi:hypothetical protein